MTYIFVLIWPNDFADGVVVKSLSQFSYVILMIIDRKMPLEFIFKRHLLSVIRPVVPNFRNRHSCAG